MRYDSFVAESMQLAADQYEPPWASLDAQSLPWLGVEVQVTLAGLSALLSIAIWQPFYPVRKRSRQGDGPPCPLPE
jgi:hypothetical protein